MELKPGDLIKCVNNDGCVSTLTLGRVYRVKSKNKHFPYMIDLDATDLGQKDTDGWFHWRFALADGSMSAEMEKVDHMAITRELIRGGFG